MKKLVFKLCLLFCLTNASAWDGAVTGAINSLSVVPANGIYDLRVTLTNVNTMCTGSAYSFAYLNTTDENYKGVLASLLMAYSTGKLAFIYTMKDANNFCKIGYVSIYG